jgi:hypothetical protein
MAKDKGSKDSKSSSKVWSAMSLASALGAAAVARKVLDKGWQLSTGRKPPENPADPDVQVGEAIAWAVLTGASVAVVRMLAQRRAANYYVKSAGELPPQLSRDGQ